MVLKRIYSKERNEKISKALIGKKVSEETKNKLREWSLNHNPWKGCHHTDEEKEKIRKNHARPNLSKSLTTEHKRKLRIAAIKNIKKGLKSGNSMIPFIGKEEKRILDELEYKFKLPILRQYEVCGYFLDGYIPQSNIAIEIDEPYHTNIRKYKKDLEREMEIEKMLGCIFLRIKL